VYGDSTERESISVSALICCYLAFVLFWRHFLNMAHAYCVRSGTHQLYVRINFVSQIITFASCRYKCKCQPSVSNIIAFCQTFGPATHSPLVTCSLDRQLSYFFIPFKFRVTYVATMDFKICVSYWIRIIWYVTIILQSRRGTQSINPPRDEWLQ
jgi:hypothetical protein